jgi:hypothetical protein
MEQSLQDRIRERAYHIWNSGVYGDETYFWLMAERELTAEITEEIQADMTAVQSNPDMQPTGAKATRPRKAPAPAKSLTKSGADTEIMTHAKVTGAPAGKVRSRSKSTRQATMA